ncbi:BTAD domain-containing putative transcriptional regulator [Streptomyces sp. NPDC060194]|uniref:BTAD domain-containing putative transcriptional regulator n=1 Tax=Streptomyces sp. NPDC060194 TaxID=3347069 RepID=UPI00364BE089
MAERTAPVGELLRSFRGRSGLSQEAAAARGGLSTRALRDIERGRVARPRERSLRRLASALGLAEGEQDALLRAGRSGPVPAPPGPRLLVLGPAAVRRGRDTVAVSGPMVRRLLGLLALRYPGEATDREITDTLWPSGPPSSHRSLTHTYVSQVRRLLADDGPRSGPAPGVVRTPAGYRIDVAARQIDLGLFDELLARAERSRHTPDEGPETAYETLTRALGLWRGPVLADADPVLRGHPAAVAADERRIRAALLHADLALRLGRAAEALPGLWALAGAEPLHEPLHARLVLALAAGGGQAAALDVFARLRTRLDEELGIAPGAELREAQLRVLRQQLPPAAGASAGGTEKGSSRERAVPVRGTGRLRGRVPAQLPARTGAHVGREPEKAVLDELVASDLSVRRHVVAVVGGAGVGKTALATHWAHIRREEFPDGQLYVDLRGWSPQPARRLGDVLGQFLRALGVADGDLPADDDEAAALYRTLLADRRMLVVLDNARDAEQVRPLVPGAQGCAVVVTSRDQLAGLVANDGARRVALDVLGRGDARDLLGGVVGACRVVAEADDADRLVRACGGLPLAVRIAGANIVARGTGIGDHADVLAGSDVLDHLYVAGDRRSAVRTAFDLSYRALPEPARRMLRLLAQVREPGPTAAEAARLAGVTPEAAAGLLGALTDEHLAREDADGRFALHVLVRAYARERAAEEGTPSERSAGRIRRPADAIAPDRTRCASRVAQVVAGGAAGGR